MSTSNGARPTIFVVSGLPRAGTSMLMQMLEAAGFPLLSDGTRAPDASNPRGYYEFEPVKSLKRDDTFLEAAVGRVVKVVAPLLPSLPPDYDYRILFIERDLEEVLASQREMLGGSGESADPQAEAALSRAFEASLRHVREWIEGEEGVRACFVSHAEVLASPERIARVIHDFFQAGGLESGGLVPGGTGAGAAESGADMPGGTREEIVERMASIVDGALHRQRSGAAGQAESRTPGAGR